PPDVQLVVYSSSIEASNAELVNARRRNIPLVHRSDIVAGFVNAANGVAVTGAHGKTTTTSLCAILATMAGLDPTVVIGGEVDFFEGNWRAGNGDVVVCEADESDGTFLKLKPKYGILTNIDREHLDHYGDIDHVIEANRMFMNNVRGDGCLIACGDDPRIAALLAGYAPRRLTYGITAAGIDIRAVNISMDRFRTSFEALYRGRSLGAFELHIPGMHNVYNSMAAIALGVELGVEIGVIRKALTLYGGAKRRFQVKGCVDEIMVVEDYAHHPTEIAATIAACRNWPGHRIVGVFQPHRYSRTVLLREEFGRSFAGLDELILTDLYSAAEDPIDGVSTAMIYDEVLKNGQERVRLLGREEVLPYLMKNVRPQDIVLVLGAGDIGELSDELVRALEAKKQIVV
ncbi:MAG: UDP-N-acetylmuramate--L-alanine ligase, partial [Candidatus Omnitrophota bacterium]